MYRLINTTTEQFLPRLDRDVRSYVVLLMGSNTPNGGLGAAFRSQYRQYWRMNAARLSNNFYDRYFVLLEAARGRTDVSIESVVTTLCTVDGGRHGVQFSFATKLVHMLDPAVPVYDSMVETFFLLPTPKPNWPAPQKISHLLDNHAFLVREYRRVLHAGLLSHAMDRFNDRFSPSLQLTNEKIIDFLIWGFVRWARSGAVKNGHISYC